MRVALIVAAVVLVLCCTGYVVTELTGHLPAWAPLSTSDESTEDCDAEDLAHREPDCGYSGRHRVKAKRKTTRPKVVTRR